jgi:uncharacterized protein (DUF433 family)
MRRTADRNNLNLRLHRGNLCCVNYRERIVRDPQVCGGEPTIRGTRITLRTVLASLSDGDSIEDIVRDYPTLSTDDVRAVIAFAADSVREDLPAPKAVGF